MKQLLRFALLLTGKKVWSILILTLLCTRIFANTDTTKIVTIVSAARAQNKQADSLRLLLKRTAVDTTRVNLLVELSKLYYLERPDSGLIYATQAQAISKKIGYAAAQIHALTQMGFCMWVMGNSPAALQMFITSQNMATALNDKWSIARNYDGLSCAYMGERDFKTGVAYARKSQVLFRELGDYVNVVDELMDESDFLMDDNQADAALIAGKEALAVSLKINETKWRSQVYTALGRVYLAKDQQKLGMAYLYKSMAFSTKYGQPFNLANAYVALSEAYRTLGNRDSCIYFAKKLYQITKAISFAALMVQGSNILADQYYGIDNNESARYYRIAQTVKDSLFNADKAKQFLTIQIADQQRTADLKNAAIAYQNKLKLWAVLLALALVMVILALVWRNSKKQQTANKLLESQKQQIEDTLQELKTTQTQLIQSEKMASLGELTAGIAHEIQNPLNFVNNFSEVNTELIDEMQQEIDKGDYEEVKVIANDIKENQQKISQHGKRADFIVKGMLEHSRTSTGERIATNINVLTDEFLKLSYHGLRAKDKNFNAELITNFDENLPKVNIVQQDIGRVLLNLFNNAFYAVNQKQKVAGADYKPEISVTTSTDNGNLVIKVKDNGNGIPDAIKEKIMQPFFTTKPTGEGTGLGLSLSYDIVVKGHVGKITVNSNEGAGSEFIIQLPIS